MLTKIDHPGSVGAEGTVEQGIASVRPAMTAVLVFSLFCNILLFVSPIYMLQIYDRVVTSRSEMTLLTLSCVAAFLLIIYALLEALRSRILVRAGLLFNHCLATPVFGAVHRSYLSQPGAGHTQALRDIDVLRDFFTGPGLLALCDAPWFPLFVAGAFLLHPVYGWLALGGSVVIVGLTLVNEFATRRQLRAASKAGAAALQNAQASLRNSEVVQAMGMLAGVRRLWERHHDEQLCQQAKASDRAGVLVAATRFSRMFLQIAILGAGAYLAIHREVSAGSIVAASILVGRALQPVELVVTHWKGFVAAREALTRIRATFAAAGRNEERMNLPRPKGAVVLDGVAATAPGQQRQILHDVSFVLPAGQVLAVVGPSAAGKSSLARLLVGVWSATGGTVRLDGHNIRHFHPEELGRHIGYLPQDVELFEGTVAQNVARFQEIDTLAIIAAARAAGCHEMIQHLPDGYDTHIGEAGRGLSGGQRQRIGLARALYGRPALVVLDEPNANLDLSGEESLVCSLGALREAGTTTVVISHKVNILAAADLVLLLRNGTVEAFGGRDEILQRLASSMATRRENHTAPAPVVQVARHSETARHASVAIIASV